VTAPFVELSRARIPITRLALGLSLVCGWRTALGERGSRSAERVRRRSLAMWRCIPRECRRRTLMKLLQRLESEGTMPACRWQRRRNREADLYRL
jgi:hypothetical protein